MRRGPERERPLPHVAIEQRVGGSSRKFAVRIPLLLSWRRNMGQDIEEAKRTPAPSAGRWPLLIAAMVICAIGWSNLYRLTTATAPRNPWESVQVLEAWRSMRGMPVYELPPDGHATHMYGALVPWVQGMVFRV